MSGHWREVARLKFKGHRFQDHALDLTALTELSQFQRIVAETAKALWRAAHPGRERLPAHFEDRTRLCLRRIEEGSAVAPLEVFVEEPESPQLFEPDVPEVNEAIELAQDVFRAAEADEPLPDRLPKSLLSEYGRWGQGLREDETIEIETPSRREPARVTPRARARLSSFIEGAYEASGDFVGEILEADVRQRRFQLWLDDRTVITAAFPPEMEDQVTAALREHRLTRVRVRGRAEFSPQGRPTRLVTLDAWELLLPAEVQPLDESAPAVEDVLQEVPPECRRNTGGGFRLIFQASPTTIFTVRRSDREERLCRYSLLATTAATRMSSELIAVMSGA